MGIKEDYKQAQQLAKQGQLEEARNLLIVHDHAKTNALLERVNKALAAKGQSANSDSDNKINPIARFASTLVIVIVATGIVVFLGTSLYSAFPDGLTNEGIIYAVLAGIWIGLLYLGNKLSRRLLGRRSS